jgi:hypothetical protein
VAMSCQPGLIGRDTYRLGILTKPSTDVNKPGDVHFRRIHVAGLVRVSGLSLERANARIHEVYGVNVSDMTIA